MSGEISSKLYTSNPLIFMMDMSLLRCTCVRINAFGMSTTATSLCSSAPSMHVISTDYVATVGELVSYLKI